MTISKTITAPAGSEALLLSEMTEKVLLHVSASDRDMANLRDCLKFFAPNREIIEFPAWDSLPYDRASPNPSIVAKRVEALCKLANIKSQKSTIVLTTVNAIIQKLPPKKVIESSSLVLEKGKAGARDYLTNYLHKNGYDRVSKVMQPGEYAVRGSIVDLFPSGYEDGIRVDYFGDEVESIREFDPISQISGGDLPIFRLMPASEIIYDENSIERFKSNYRKTFGAVVKEDLLYEAISSGAKYPGMENWLPLFYEEMATLFDYLPADVLVVQEHEIPHAFEQRIELIHDYFDARKTGNTAYKPTPIESLYNLGTEAEILQKNNLVISPFSAENSIQSGYHKGQKIGLDFEQLKGFSKPIFISCFSQGSLEHISGILKSHSIPANQIESWKLPKTQHPTPITHLFVAPIESGFENNNFIIISEQDIFGDRFIRTVKKKKSSENFLMEAAGFSVGELIVHEQHGIGKFAGLETLEVNGKRHDMLRLIYDGGDRMFVPVENIEVISRYGSDEENVRLDKLGGVAWQERKSKLKERIKLAADALLKIAAERELKQAAKFIPDDAMYNEFCTRFPYTETDDQLRAIEEVSADLAKGRPMDRLICGDVGFGKTEVALRASFIAASQGVQVAIIGPTTLLARQHYKTFAARFDGLPLRVRQLSRMVNAADSKKVKDGLKDGSVDIVIGTHALLSEDIEFKNLGLVIIDEEQHFGVKQKERLKNLRAEVHVMALSATPIPRSLQMAMSGVRDLSIIATPPVDRLAVRTFVMPFDELVIREAILRERNRGGRIFYVAPRISDLEELHKKLTKLVPEAKFGLAHGKLTPTDLDKIMNQFFDGEFDVLLSTAIVESGLDISAANTLIIHRADMFGLAALYQLRGRVGRGKTRAYAYFTTEARKSITDNALKRLEVIQSLDQLGAGFSVASHDMDIRGFGNLLGEEQSGHVKEVGVELYQKMLNEAILKARGEQQANSDESFSPDINIGASILIPDFYVEDLDLRMGLYKRAAGLKTEEDIDSFRIELRDRFGKLPQEVEQLLEVIKLKALCRKAGVGKVDVGAKAIVVQFHESARINTDKLLAYVSKNQKTIKIRPDNKLVFVKDETEDFEENRNALLEVLKELSSLSSTAAL